MSIIIPHLFTCPISLELLNDPVTLCTGQTYDRPCIEKWLALGNLTCPISMQKLHDLSMVPNHTLKHLIDQWLQSVHHDHDHDHDICNDNFNFKSLKHGLEAKDTTYEQKIQAIEQVRCLLLSNDLQDKREDFVQMGLFPLVIGLVFGAKYSQDMTCLVEKSLVCVIKLMGYCHLGHLNILLEVPNFENFKTLLQKGTSMIKIRLCELIQAIFLSSSLEVQDLATKIGNETNVLKSLITCLDQYQQNHEVFEGGIKAILAILSTSSPKGENREILVKQGLIHSLIGYILQLENKQEKNMVPKATKALELLLELQSGKEMFLKKELTYGVKALVRMVFRVSSDEEGSESAVNSLMILCCESKEVRDEAICGGLLTQLLFLLQSQCSGKIKTRARMLLKLLRTMWAKDPKYHIL